MVPYYFTFTTFTKGRWVGETILTVFSREFRAQPRHEYVSWRNKTNPSIKNLSNTKLDMVPNLKMKIEKQVRFSVALQNAFFQAFDAAKSKNAFWS